MPPETRTYRDKPRITWFLGNRRYFGYMMRELSSLFVLLYVLTFVVQLLLAGDPEAYRSFLAVTQSPFFLGFTAVTLAFVLWHGVTWWSLNAKVLQIRIGGRPLPPALLFVGGIVAWVLVTAITFFLLFRGF